ncbi:hypothetical protein BDR03DRAFT_1087712, partial [Suillus americanus]
MTSSRRGTCSIPTSFQSRFLSKAASLDPADTLIPGDLVSTNHERLPEHSICCLGENTAYLYRCPVVYTIIIDSQSTDEHLSHLNMCHNRFIVSYCA